MIGQIVRVDPISMSYFDTQFWQAVYSGYQSKLRRQQQATQEILT